MKKLFRFLRNYFKLITLYFKGWNHNRRVAKATGQTIKRTGTKIDKVKSYTLQEQLYDWLKKCGYTKYVHPRGIFAEQHGTVINETRQRLYIMNRRKLKWDAEKKGKAILYGQTKNTYGCKPIIQVGNKKTFEHPDVLEQDRIEKQATHVDRAMNKVSLEV